MEMVSSNSKYLNAEPLRGTSLGPKCILYTYMDSWGALVF